FNSVGLNLYRDGRDSVAPHNDHLHDIREGFPIALLSLGATRRMTIRAKAAPRRSMHVDLETGSLLVMDYATQVHYTHGIPKTIAEIVIHHYGRAAFLSRLSDPFWFQAFGTVMGMDWHSSGITTSVMAALKRGLNPRADELGLYICGGRGEQSRRTPDELRRIADHTSADGE